MDTYNFIALHGKPVAAEIAELAGTNYVYLAQIAYGHRRPSVGLARRLVAACDAIPDQADRLDLVSLLRLE